MVTLQTRDQLVHVLVVVVVYIVDFGGFLPVQPVGPVGHFALAHATLVIFCLEVTAFFDERVEVSDFHLAVVDFLVAVDHQIIQEFVLLDFVFGAELAPLCPWTLIFPGKSLPWASFRHFDSAQISRTSPTQPNSGQPNPNSNASWVPWGPWGTPGDP